MKSHKNIFIIGPGSVGKTTVGSILARIIGYEFIDLDKEFYNRFNAQGEFIDKYGYEKYAEKNSYLFNDLLIRNQTDRVFAFSSGFLIHKNHNDLVEKHKKAITENGISVLLLPAKSIDKSEEIVIARQLSRGFGLNKKREQAKFRRRFPKYLPFGDIKIFSNNSPEEIAKQIKKELSNHNVAKW
jgi:shikimate kinase